MFLFSLEDSRTGTNTFKSQLNRPKALLLRALALQCENYLAGLKIHYPPCLPRWDFGADHDKDLPDLLFDAIEKGSISSVQALSLGCIWQFLINLEKSRLYYWGQEGVENAPEPYVSILC